ncbi:MAG: CAP domain-containing protein [Chloroflexota bacterium]
MLKPSLCLFIVVSLLLAQTGMTVNAAGNGSDWVKDKSPGELANELMAAVNELRAAHGLNTLNAHPILVQIAQVHANYMASTGATTHLSADGRRPFQRALAAGYPVAGDLSLGGFYSENIQSGPNLTPQEVVDIWMGDEPHQNTMLSANRSDMGAGVAVSGGFTYFVLDTALASSAPVENLLATIAGHNKIRPGPA